MVVPLGIVVKTRLPGSISALRLSEPEAVVTIAVPAFPVASVGATVGVGETVVSGVVESAGVTELSGVTVLSGVVVLSGVAVSCADANVRNAIITYPETPLYVTAHHSEPLVCTLTVASRGMVVRIELPAFGSCRRFSEPDAVVTVAVVSTVSSSVSVSSANCK